MNKQILLFVMMFLPMVAGAFSGEAVVDGSNYLIVTKARTAEVRALPNGKYTGDIVIPESIVYDGIECRVENINNNAFQYCYGLLSVTIPNSITSIGNYLFRGSSSLISVSIPTSVTSIGEYAFSGCSSLATITIPNSVTSIGNNVFENCIGLISISIPNSITSLGTAWFYGCSGLISVSIPNSVTIIGNNTFENCKSLFTFTIPDSITRIGNYAFNGCSSLVSLTIGSGVTTISYRAFANCPELTDVYCLAENVPNPYNIYYADYFYGSYIEYATLHVPSELVEAYKSEAPWNSFKSIVAIENETPERKCATPTIAFVDGKLTFSCEMEDVEYSYEIKSDYDAKGIGDEVQPVCLCTVSVYATKEGWENSDVATLEFTLGSNGDVCDVNGDGAVNVADIATIISKMIERDK